MCGDHDLYRLIAVLDGASDALHDLSRLVWQGLSHHWSFVASSALYMGMHPRLRGIVYGFGLFLNGVFYLAAASIAYYAIRLGNVQVHKDWMIRTYILACAGIVGDRIVPDMTFVARRIGIDALNDISGWANWAVPLMIAEIILQLRRLRKTRRPTRLDTRY